MNARRWLLLRIAGYAVGLYLLSAVSACTVADGMLFHPEASTRAKPRGGFILPAKDGSPQLSAVYLPSKDARLTLWYFHGNAEDLGAVMPRLEAYRDLGFNVFAVDYPGYGLSGGKPTEESIYAASRVALDYLRDELKTPPAKLVLYGRSVGGGPAADVASHEPVVGLILESAFTSAYRVVTRWPLLPGDQFQNLRKMTHVRCPVLLIHGREDQVVPFHHGESLLAAVRGRSSHLWVEQAGHNDLLDWAGDRYWQALRDFTQTL